MPWRSAEFNLLDGIKIGHENKKDCVASVRERTIPTERPPLVGEVNTQKPNTDIFYGKA
jgi:hypothetical protein